MAANTTKVVVAAITAPVSKQVASKSAASGKRGYHKAPSTAVVARRSLRFDPAYQQLQEGARARFGFKDNPNLTPATWQTQNVKNLSAAVKTVLDGEQDHFGVKIADYNKLTAKDVAAANMISGMIG
jgi:hypothetical protein